VADSVNGQETGSTYKAGLVQPMLGKNFDVSREIVKGKVQRLETVQHKWKIVNELPEYVDGFVMGMREGSYS
jgi:hypothetical protein